MVKERERVNLSLIFDTPMLILLLSKGALLSQGEGLAYYNLEGLAIHLKYFGG
jgi:hypothetical protein